MTTPWDLAAPPTSRTLSAEHRRVLVDESGIDPSVIESRGYYTLTREMVRQLVELEVVHKVALQATDWLAIPTYRPDGVEHGQVLRLADAPMRYIWPSGTRNSADVHPDEIAGGLLDDIEVPVIITEGIKKADAIRSAARREGFKCVVIAVNGCYGWKAKTVAGTESLPLPDFLDLPWADRKVYVVSDSDYRTNDLVKAGWNGCATYFESKTGQHRTFLVVVPQDGVKKVGADDYLAAGKTLDSLLGLATTPRQALADDSTEKRPLIVKTGKQVLAEAGKEIPHLIHPIFPERAIVVIAGHSGTYKTWHMQGLMLDAAFGLRWLDHPDFRMRERPFSTLYVNKEMGGVLFSNRLKLLSEYPRYKSRPDFDEVISTRIFSTDEAELDLNDPDQRSRLEAAIMHAGVELVILDSLSMVWSGNEDSNSEIGAFYAKLRGITERTGTSWGIIHHLLKPTSQVGKKTPAKFTVRGAGQIIQQADSAILLSPYNEEEATPEVLEISVESMKTRTDREPPSFISRFSVPDGLYAKLEYGGKVAEEAAKSYVAPGGGDPRKITTWLIETMGDMPAMRPGSSGLRTKQLIALLQSSWPVEDKNAPSERTLQRRIEALVETGALEVLEEDKKHGNLYRFPDEPAATPITVIHAPAPAPPIGSGGGPGD